MSVGTWWIGLAPWIVQDGSYTDFAAGERRQFAVEFGYRRSARLAVVPPTRPSCRYAGRTTTYDVTGRLLRSATSPRSDAFVLDVGALRAYQSWMVLDDLEPPPEGTWLAGSISLHVDPFIYRDELAGLPGMPPLIYTWRIEEVQLATTPLIQVEHGHPLYAGPDEGPHRVPDPARESWRTVERTRAWEEDGDYRLRCSLEDIPPESTMARSGPHSPYGPLPDARSAT